jgi:DNA-binding GntR family transcriptional regulator
VPDADNAEVWSVLTSAASSVEFEDAHDAGMHVYPAAIDHAVQDLSPAELTELGRLLQAELKRSSN